MTTAEEAHPEKFPSHSQWMVHLGEHGVKKADYDAMSAFKPDNVPENSFHAMLHHQIHDGKSPEEMGHVHTRLSTPGHTELQIPFEKSQAFHDAKHQRSFSDHAIGSSRVNNENLARYQIFHDRRSQAQN